MFVHYKTLLNRMISFSDRYKYFKIGKHIKAKKKNKKMSASRIFEQYESKSLLSNAPKNASVHVLSTGAYGMGRSFLLKLDNRSYLFNCGEGTQKMILDNSLSLGEIEDLFFTYNSWENTGGVFGVLISLSAYQNAPDVVRFHGPSFVEKVMAMVVIFLEKNRGYIPDYERCGIEKKKFVNEQLTVEYVEVHAAESNKKTERIENTKAFMEKGLNGNLSFMEKTVMCYIIRLPELPRSVDIQKLVKLDVKSGPWIGELVKGQSVTLDDGRIIRLEDVMSDVKTEIGPIVVLDCPFEDYLEPLITNKQLLDLQTERIQPALMIHMAPAAIVADPRYKEFMNRFQSGTKHLMMNENSPCPYIHRSQMFQSVLNRLHPGIFPPLQGYYHYNTKPTPATDNVVQACSGLQYTIRPSRQEGFNWDSLKYYHSEPYLEYVKKEAVNESLDVIKYLDYEKHSDNLSDLSTSKIEEEMLTLEAKLKDRKREKQNIEEEKDYPEIVFLGTGCGKPSTYRSSSGILIQMRKDEYFIMDCGEGSLLQMYQMYGLEKTNHILHNLKGLFISHLHYDHHGGLNGILEGVWREMRKNKRKDKLALYAPITIKNLCHNHAKYLLPIDNVYNLFPHHVLYDDLRRKDNSKLRNETRKLLGLEEFTVVPVIHSVMAYGICIKHMDGWKLVYSGDTLPCDLLVRYGKNCDILIHEATLDGTVDSDKRSKRHSSTESAIKVGRDMNAKFIFLTHFSQKYCKLPVVSNTNVKDVGYAFDFMQVRPSQFQDLQLIKPALNALFGGHRDSVYFRVISKVNRDNRLVEKKYKKVEKKFKSVEHKYKSVEEMIKEL